MKYVTQRTQASKLLIMYRVIAEVLTSWGVNLVVAGAQVGLPTKQPDVLKIAKPKQGKLKGSHHFVR